jgi:hypothetical protein
MILRISLSKKEATYEDTVVRLKGFNSKCKQTIFQLQTLKKIVISQELRTQHQGAAVEATVALQLNQGERKKCEAFIETTKN